MEWYYKCNSNYICCLCRVSTASKQSFVMLPDKSPSKQSTVLMAGRGSVDASPEKSSSQSFNFSPQKMAALNSRYVSVSLKAADLDKVLDTKRMEHDRLDEKIKGLELARLTLENDKKRILLQIKNFRSQPSPSSSPSKVWPFPFKII